MLCSYWLHSVPPPCARTPSQVAPDARASEVVAAGGQKEEGGGWEGLRVHSSNVASGGENMNVRALRRQQQQQQSSYTLLEKVHPPSSLTPSSPSEDCPVEGQRSNGGFREDAGNPHSPQPTFSDDCSS
ncbi:hypothetical protein SprV_0301289800 [Sparganum proliferum]